MCLYGILEDRVGPHYLEMSGASLAISGSKASGPEGSGMAGLIPGMCIS